jgi:hypothetical protein
VRKRVLIATLALVGVTAAATATPLPRAAAAATPCWRDVVEGWFDGRIPATYAPSCYLDALRRLPVDARAYTTAPEDIRRAMLEAIRARGLDVTTRAGKARTLMSRRAKTAPAPAATVAMATDRPPFERIAAIGAGGAGRVPPTIVALGVAAVLLVTAAGASRLRRHSPRRDAKQRTRQPT